MAPHSSTLAWKIPWMEEPGGLQSIGSRRVGHDWAISLSLFTFMHWRRKWQPTPVFLPGKLHGQRSLVGYSPWGHKESDTTKWLSTMTMNNECSHCTVVCPPLWLQSCFLSFSKHTEYVQNLGHFVKIHVSALIPPLQQVIHCFGNVIWMLSVVCLSYDLIG